MGLNKTEVNLRRLLAAAPQQQNHGKLIHYVATSREQLGKLAEERTPEGVARVSKAKESFAGSSVKESPSKTEEKNHIPPSRGLRRRFAPARNAEDRTHDTTEGDPSVPVKLDGAAQVHIEKHGKLQEDFTDEMVGLAQQLKESSLMVSWSLQNTEKLLDSTEKAVEHSLASTGHANAQAMEKYSESFKTTCFTWLVIFVMTCIFILVVLIIRIT